MVTLRTQIAVGDLSEPAHGLSDLLEGGERVCQASPARLLPRLPIAILGVPFDPVTTSEAIARIEEMVASRMPHYLVTANVDFLVQAQADVELRRILLDAHLVLCDGTPILWASRLLGNRLPERVAGADLAPLLIQVAAQKKYRLFFLGATPESAARAVARMRTAYPALIIAGHYSPPFNTLLEFDHEEIKRRIFEAKPDLLFVAFGCPKAEKWMAMHYRSLGVPVAAGVGATIDFLAGQVKRAPMWMRRSGTEWLFRLAQEPRRLFGRYAKDLWVFGLRILAQSWHLRLRPWSRILLGGTPPLPVRRGEGREEGSVPSSRFMASPSPLQTRIGLGEVFPSPLSVPGPYTTQTNGQAPHTNGNNSAPSSDFQVLRLPKRWDLATVQDPEVLELVSGTQDCLLDLTDVQFIDSTGLGLLLRWHKQLRAADRQLVLVAPSRAVQRALSVTRLHEFFTSAPDAASAREILAQRRAERSSVVILPAVSESTPVLAWQGEVTAANIESVWEQTRAPLASVKPPAGLVIDLSRVRFIDSSGLGLMVRAKKVARSHGATLAFTGLQPAVHNVVRLAQLEAFLLDMTPSC